MRLSKTITLDDGRFVTVQELRVKDIRQLLSGFTDLDKINVMELLGPRFSEIAALVSPFIIFPKGESLDDLCGSELQAVIDAVKEVNATFLTLAGLKPVPSTALMASPSAPVPSAPLGERSLSEAEAILTEPASSSSNEDTQE